MQIVWFKRDLRIQDHMALSEAAKIGPILPLYIIEPTLWTQPDMSYRHYAFLQECLQELSHELLQLGGLLKGLPKHLLLSGLLIFASIVLLQA